MGLKETRKLLPVVWNKPIDPETDRDFPKKRYRPVTLEDLGKDYLTAGLRYIPVKGATRQLENQLIIGEKNIIDLPGLKKELAKWNNQSLVPGTSSEDCRNHNFGNCLWLNHTFFKAKNWKTAVDEIARQGFFIFNVWGYYPESSIQVVTEEQHEYVLRKLGPKFLGWDIGEKDGHWFGLAEQTYPALVNRRDGWKNFREWQTEIFEEEYCNCAALCSLTYPHYYLEMGVRMIGAEFLQALPSINMWACFIRGAARQYQTLWFAGISVWNRFGWKRFTANQSTASHSGNQSGPDHGPTLTLVEQTWLVLYSYGVNIQALEASQFLQPPGADQEYLSPLGETQLKLVSFSHRFAKRRGVQYSPVALLLDFLCGWTPPRHIYSDSPFNVWGTIPYEPGDHQIDLFFREAFPDYQDCPFFHDGKGTLTATPHGDIFDVLLSNARPDILARYRLACVLGEIKIEGEVLDKLLNYAENGGEVIWSYCQLSENAKKAVGLIDRHKIRKGKKSIDPRDKRTFDEKPYRYPEVSIIQGDVWLTSESGHPLLASVRKGKGRITTIIPPFGLGAKKELESGLPLSYPNNVYGDWDADVNFSYLYWDKPLGSPYHFLNGVRQTWFEYLDTFNLVEITASDVPGWNDEKVVGDYGLDPETPLRKLDIQFTTALREEPDKLVVTLVNTNLVSVYGRLRVKGARIIKALDVLDGDQKMAIRKDGGLNFHLRPKDFSGETCLIMELRLDRPIVRFGKEGAPSV